MAVLLIAYLSFLGAALAGVAFDAQDINSTFFESIFLAVAKDPVPGFKPLYGYQERVLDVAKRDCLPNGTNFCFGDNTNFCPSCGTCCTTGGNFCCSSSQTCCGTGCCSAGETCTSGKCVAASTTSSSSSV